MRKKKYNLENYIWAIIAYISLIYVFIGIHNNQLGTGIVAIIMMLISAYGATS